MLKLLGEFRFMASPVICLVLEFLSYFFILLPVSSQTIYGTTYVVGGSLGWTNFNTSSNGPVDYQSWANHYSFFVNDILEFNYVPGRFNLYSVDTYEHYVACNFSTSSLLDNGTSGSSVWYLPFEGHYDFACSTYCNEGQKFRIYANNISTSAAPSTEPSAAPSPSVTSPSPSPGATAPSPGPPPVLSPAPSLPPPSGAPSPAPSLLTPSSRAPAPLAPSPAPERTSPSPSPSHSPLSPFPAPTSPTPMPVFSTPPTPISSTPAEFSPAHSPVSSPSRAPPSALLSRWCLLLPPMLAAVANVML